MDYRAYYLSSHHRWLIAQLISELPPSLRFSCPEFTALASNISLLLSLFINVFGFWSALSFS
jgi:hypothetical protein